MAKVMIIGAGGVGAVVAHKCAQVPEVFEEIEPEAWDETVVRPEILEKPDIQYVRSE